MCINCSVVVIFSPHFQSRIGEKTPQRPSVEAGSVLLWRVNGRAKYRDDDVMPHSVGEFAPAALSTAVRVVPCCTCLTLQAFAQRFRPTCLR